MSSKTPCTTVVRSHRLPGNGATRAVAAVVAALTLMVSLLIAAPAAQAAQSGTLTAKASGSASTQIGSTRTSSVALSTITVPAASSLPVYVGVQFRASSIQNGYRLKLRINPDRTVSASFSRVRSGVETPIGTPTKLNLEAKPGEKLRIRTAVVGLTTVKMYLRAWKSGKSEPKKWTVAAKDASSARITKKGKTYLWALLSSTAKATSAKLKYSSVSVKKYTAKKAARASVQQWAKAASSVAAPPEQKEAAPSAPQPTPEPAPKAGQFPDASTTGPRAGTTLKRHDGDITVTTPGTVLENLDIHGFVTIKAANVTIRNSIVRGGRAKGYAIGLITNYGYAGLVIEDTRIEPEFRSVEFDGIKGNNFTARRVHIVGGVDNIKIHSGSNVTIQDSLLENTDYYASDPLQGGGATHNDNIQILDGKNIKITNNTIRGAQNFAVLGGAHHGDITMNLVGNYLDGGHCTVKLQLAKTWSNTATVTNNTFGPNRKVKSCPFTAYPTVKLTEGGNHLTTGTTVKALITVS